VLSSSPLAAVLIPFSPLSVESLFIFVFDEAQVLAYRHWLHERPRANLPLMFLLVF